MSKEVCCLVLGVTLSVAGVGARAADPFPKAPEHDLVVRVCSGCHVPEVVTAKTHTAEEWDDIIAKMVDHGAQANDAQQEQILAYLVRFYGKPAGS